MAQALQRRSLVLAPTPPVAQGEVVREEEVSFLARDGFPLRGTLYAAAETPEPADIVVFNTGCGLAASRYRHFLRYIALVGIPVLAYNYRGIGCSAPASRRGFDAGLDDWALLDQPAAIEFAQRRFPGARVASVSHSIGCLIAATATDSHKVAQFVFVAPHTGYWGDYMQPWRVPMALFWHALMPTVARVLGYFPASRLGLGDDFPKGVALQWAGRRHAAFGTGSFDIETKNRLADNARLLSAPILLLTMAGDAFAGEDGCLRLVQCVPNARLIRRHLDIGKPLGHFDYFRRRNAPLWSIVGSYLKTMST